MGDVFDAMNRARKERGEQTESPDASQERFSDPDEWSVSQNDPSIDPNDDVSPALPIDQVQTPHDHGMDEVSPLDGEITPKNYAESQTPDPDKASDEGKDKGGDAEAGSGDPSLNGYAPEVVVHHDKGGAITEQYRAIRTQILARARNRSLRTHVITSSGPAEGKSVSTVNLGITFSELKNQKTLLIEGDLRRPSFQKLFHRDFNKGMLQLLTGEIQEIDQVLHKTVYPNLDFIPAGGHNHERSTELLTSPRMTKILEQLKERYDHIFIDSPPVVSVTDAAILGAMTDQVLLVVRLYKTPQEVVDRAKRLLRANNCEVAGVILTHLKVHLPRYLYRYGYGYNYNYGYGYNYNPTKKS